MTPSRRAAESATSPLLTKAAEEAVAEIVPHLENINCRLNAYGKDQLRVIILKHLAPVQKEMKEARELIAMIGTTETNYVAACQKAQAWLARNQEGEGV